ncbi:CRP-like cAMP-binding protein [Pontibacter ummariensis]|uniref:cAMP-binding domain of CRP or a regulatory subunit of cAMP-dependent protein kinases n=1 Tax=Pontibacter ummariensis TaxID=1610492 RepID=A0A239IDZ0_9BACT|nr:Crp/Fnr family transcriptional regulator [Pontibacter ummariensis]PRY09803.1 CRP-like cAMP-binding protein [Pontibacter ummariensis]SNS91749.1 cAMP-binding domain of CRP or a regulatory subunit of cAMP-dependent protein kinases [Pontibacter ummariensis]
MDIEKLCQAVGNMRPLPGSLRDKDLLEEVKGYLREHIAVSHYAQRQLLLSAGQHAEHIYFVVEGFARGFYHDAKTGRDITIFLWDEQSFAVAVNSFFLREPSDLYLEVLPGSKLLSLSYGQLNTVFEKYPPTEALVRLLALHYSAYHKKRTLDLLTCSAWERYVDLLCTCPRIEQKVSKEVIASFLGITPQSLSRLIKDNGHP